MKRITLLVLVGFLSVVMSGCGYNSLQVKEEGVFKAWADVEATLQRRADLIPNLVNVVKGYAKHEKQTLTAVVEARAKATSTTIDPSNLNAESIQAFQQAQGGLSSALSKLMVVVERYPDLKANQNFLELQSQLEGTENRIAVERRKFKPHLTMLRIKKNPGKEFISKFIEHSFENWNFNTSEITLIKSELFPTGARYTDIKKYNLK